MQEKGGTGFQRDGGGYDSVCFSVPPRGHLHMMSAKGGTRGLPQMQMQCRSLVREVT